MAAASKLNANESVQPKATASQVSSLSVASILKLNARGSVQPRTTTGYSHTGSSDDGSTKSTRSATYWALDTSANGK